VRSLRYVHHAALRPLLVGQSARMELGCCKLQRTAKCDQKSILGAEGAAIESL